MLVICLLIVLLLVFLNLGSFLIVNENPVMSDVIVVLAGDTGGRTAYSVMLLKSGYSENLLCTGGRHTPNYDSSSVADAMKKQAINSGISENHIIVEDQAVSTYENAAFSKVLLLKYGYKSAIVVTSDYHMRRSRIVFNKVFKGTGINLTFCSSKDHNFTPEKWWTNNYSRNIVCSEYIKLIGYFVAGRL
jgi:uncharacterized SAM-binding protein YcdF (DUF218 family)